MSGYKPKYRVQNVSEWDDLIYFIRRGLVDQAKSFALSNKLRFSGSTHVRTNKETVLHVCAEFDQCELFKWFFKRYNCDFSVVNDAGETPLIIAAREGKTAVIKLMWEELQEAGNNLNVNHKMKDGWTALTYAAMNGFVVVVEQLLKMGAEVRNVDKFHRNALHWAARFNNVNMIEKLL